MANLNQRIQAIKAMSWRDTKELAERYGLEKPDGMSWDDMAPAIAEAEAASNDTVSDAEPTTEKTPKSVKVKSSTPVPNEALAARLERLGFRVCGVCGQQHRNTATGEPLCPEQYSGCPRLQGGG